MQLKPLDDRQLVSGLYEEILLTVCWLVSDDCSLSTLAAFFFYSNDHLFQLWFPSNCNTSVTALTRLTLSSDCSNTQSLQTGEHALFLCSIQLEWLTLVFAV
uniref:PPUP7358 n=1 Tax=Poeciliopsis prolifica TaxID=188132 RepID=A0A0S7ETD5_9TELE